MKNIILTSCGIINDDFKNRFYDVIDRDSIGNKIVLYVTTASDGEDGDKSWMDNEYKTIIDLGFDSSNIIEYKIGNSININDFDIIYMMGGNTFYLLDMIRKYKFDSVIKEFLNNGGIYIGSSAGSIIMGNSIELALPFDENKVNITDFTGLRLVNNYIIPHANNKTDFINNLNDGIKNKLIVLNDGDGLII